ncbi:cytochrome P450 [Rhodobium orientis]|uniref:Cytochrome P450 n=1 Tax=Rhodobium orientis TaxID=34017 RepID=A0A327K2B2_9HYPH|nr:cytochrome P450 [Rhodobium orientis]MBB4303985.1 cytochrome P450 [Rhodobium orientis]MBK5950805.1 hypothetical protein [Rhodobium orientis]RAI29528.1 hypothetical protein CH339_02445 [Rhodobium orientis]
MDDVHGRSPVRPAAPVPPTRNLRLLSALRALRANPITLFPRQAYVEPVLALGRGRRSILLVNDPCTIGHVLVDNAGNYVKSRLQQDVLAPGLGEGLLTAEGARWQATRRITAPLFSPRAVATLLEDMRSCALAMRDRWLARPQPGETVDLAAEFQRLTYEVVSRTLFSGALDADRAGVHAEMAVYFDSIGRLDLSGVLGLPGWWPRPAHHRAAPAIRSLRQQIKAAVSARLGDEEHEREDLLERLSRAADPATGQMLSAGQVVDNVLTFLAAGHETTANALSWIAYLLSLDPAAEAAVVDEIAACAPMGIADARALDRLSFTRAVINEALRLYPPAPFIGREAIEDDRICGREIRPGAQILIAPWVVHRHRAHWSEPDMFRPQRFLDDCGDRRRPFLPFGLGPRICIGQRFAMQEMLIVLSAILPAFRFEPVDPDRVFPLARVTLSPAGGLPVRLVPR